MEGLIPFVYRAIVHYRNSTGRQQLLSNRSAWWLNLNEPSPLSSPRLGPYVRLSGEGDSASFQPQEAHLNQASSSTPAAASITRRVA